MVIFYTEILTGKIVLWCFFLSETSERIHNSTFHVKISVWNVIFSNEMEKLPKCDTYFSIEFGKIISYVYTEIFVYCHGLIINRYFTCYVDVFKFWKSYQTFFIGIYYSKNWIWCQNICRAITTSWVQRLGPSLPIYCPFFKSINKIVPRSLITEGQNFFFKVLTQKKNSWK